MALKFDREIDQPLKTSIEAVQDLIAMGAGPFHTQGELVLQSGMDDLEKNTNLLVEAADVFFGKTLTDYAEALQKMMNNQMQVKEALGIQD